MPTKLSCGKLKGKDTLDQHFLPKEHPHKKKEQAKEEGKVFAGNFNKCLQKLKMQNLILLQKRRKSTNDPSEYWPIWLLYTAVKVFKMTIATCISTSKKGVLIRRKLPLQNNETR